VQQQRGQLDLNRIDRVVLEPQELSAYGLQPGDILMNRVNTPELVGKGAEVYPLYLWALLTSRTQRPAIEVLAGGSAGSMPNISKSRLETLDIEKPPEE
jgi:hypothetical protein